MSILPQFLKNKKKEKWAGAYSSRVFYAMLSTSDTILKTRKHQETFWTGDGIKRELPQDNLGDKVLE